MAETISMGARREVLAAVAERYRAAGRCEKGRMLDELCATTGWHRKHALRALRGAGLAADGKARRQRGRKYDGAIKDALKALWEASDRVCGKRLVVMIPTLLPVLERHGRLCSTRTWTWLAAEPRADRARHRRPLERKASPPVRKKAAFDRAAAAQGAEEEGCGEARR